MISRLTQKILLAVACCFALALAPMSVAAQSPGGLIKKGAQGVQKGVETGVEKTKEGAEAVGKGVKKAVTDEDTDNSDRMKPAQTNPSSGQREMAPGRTSTKSAHTGRMESENKRLPKTAGELPLLALAGALALVGSAIIRRQVT